MNSYSGYLDDLSGWYAGNISPNFLKCRAEIMNILQEENALLEIVKLVGQDSLADSQRRTLEIARVIREEFAQQNAYDPEDTYVPISKQYQQMEAILNLYR